MTQRPSFEERVKSDWKEPRQRRAAASLPPAPEASRYRGGLLLQTEALQQRWWLRILHRLVLCSRILSGPNLYTRILIPPHSCSGIMRGPDLCPRILDGPDPSVLSNGPDRRSLTLQNLCPRISCRRYRLDLCLCILHWLHT